MPEVISITAYEELRGVSVNAVRQAMLTGRIAQAVRRDEAGKLIGVDVALANELWDALTDPPQSERKSRGTSPAAGYYEHRSEREKIAAQLAQLELEQRLGRLVNAEQAAAEFGAVLRRVRDSFLRAF